MKLAEQEFLFFSQRYEYSGNNEGIHAFVNNEAIVGLTGESGEGLSVSYVENEGDSDARVDIFHHLMDLKYKKENRGIIN